MYNKIKTIKHVLTTIVLLALLTIGITNTCYADEVYTFKGQLHNLHDDTYMLTSPIYYENISDWKKEIKNPTIKYLKELSTCPYILPNIYYNMDFLCDKYGESILSMFEHCFYKSKIGVCNTEDLNILESSYETSTYEGYSKLVRHRKSVKIITNPHSDESYYIDIYYPEHCCIYTGDHAYPYKEGFLGEPKSIGLIPYSKEYKTTNRDSVITDVANYKPYNVSTSDYLTSILYSNNKVCNKNTIFIKITLDSNIEVYNNKDNNTFSLRKKSFNNTLSSVSYGKYVKYKNINFIKSAYTTLLPLDKKYQNFNPVKDTYIHFSDAFEGYTLEDDSFYDEDPIAEGIYGKISALSYLCRYFNVPYCNMQYTNATDVLIALANDNYKFLNLIANKSYLDCYQYLSDVLYLKSSKLAPWIEIYDHNYWLHYHKLTRPFEKMQRCMDSKHFTLDFIRDGICKHSSYKIPSNAQDGHGNAPFLLKLDGDTIINKGSGTFDDPYIIDDNSKVKNEESIDDIVNKIISMTDYIEICKYLETKPLTITDEVIKILSTIDTQYIKAGTIQSMLFGKECIQYIYLPSNTTLDNEIKSKYPMYTKVDNSGVLTTANKFLTEPNSFFKKENNKIKIIQFIKYDKPNNIGNILVK